MGKKFQKWGKNRVNERKTSIQELTERRDSAFARNSTLTNKNFTSSDFFFV